MKRGYKNLLSVFGAIGLVVPFAGCETDAQEADPATNQATSVTSAGAGAGADSASATSTNAATDSTKATTKPDAATTSTNAITDTTAAPTSDSGTNTVAGQEGPIVLNKIPPSVPANVKLSKGVEEIVKLAQAGLSETVMLLYVEKATEEFDLDASEIIYLNDIGIPSTVIAAMLDHDGKGQDILHDALDTNQVQVATAPPQTVVTQAPPQQLVVTSNYVAAHQPNGVAVAQDPSAQQQVIVEQQPAVVVQQPSVLVTGPATTYSYFYSSLAPYGSWVEVNGYGWCWQPTIAVSHHGWRPYLHGGRWLTSDVGWYWHSDYSWGWAPFHYGRWYCAPRVGWVWCPDYTWGPSWVTWRRSPTYCGWAPLPPHCDVRPGFGFSYWGSSVGFSFNFGYSHDYYAWVPAGRFCDRRLTDHVVHSERTANIYKDSTIVNNYIVGNNNTIVNNGIGRDFVRSHTQRELPRVRVAEATPAVARTVRPDRPMRVGNENVVFRPERPAQNLVQAHEQTVARTRNEVARPGGLASAGGTSSGNVIPSRTQRPQAITPTSPNAGTAGRNEIANNSSSRGNAPVTRGETVRPLTRNAGPVFGTPAPVRPEPDRSAEILRSRNLRSSQEVVARPNVSGSAGGGSGSIATSRPGANTEVVRPSSGATPVAPRLTPSVPSTQTGTSGTRGSVETMRPGRGPSESPAVSSPTVRPSGSRTETGRTSPGFSTPPAQQTPATRTETVRPSSPTPQAVNRSSLTQPRSEPARSPDLVNTQPQVTRRSSVESSAIARPAPSVAQPVTRSAPSSQGNVSVSPQPIQRSTPSFRAPAVTATPRTETFSRPSAPVRSAPAPVVVRPQPVTRAPAGGPSITAPPAVSSAPQINRSSAPIGGGNFRSAPPTPAAPSVSRPSPAPAQPSARPSGSQGNSSGRGRVEIGR